MTHQLVQSSLADAIGSSSPLSFTEDDEGARVYTFITPNEEEGERKYCSDGLRDLIEKFRRRHLVD